MTPSGAKPRPPRPRGEPAEPTRPASDDADSIHDEQPKKPKGRGAIVFWLGLASTLIAIATGMFTLRDQVFPHQRGSAEGLGGTSQVEAARVCDELNDINKEHARALNRLKAELRRAHTDDQQRRAILFLTRRAIANWGHALARFEAIEVPGGLRAVESAPVKAWKRNLGRLEMYASRLDRASTRGQTLRAVDYLWSVRGVISADSVIRQRGLLALGADCELDAPLITRPVTLPKPRDGSGAGSSSEYDRRPRFQDVGPGSPSSG